nr:methyltransferase domain-containing protein [uncultured Rhodopila sp.]
MNDNSDLAAEVAAYFDRRSATYDAGDFHPRLTARLIEAAGIKAGQTVLDVATGTGLVAIEAARRVGASGRVIGLDISPGMLAQARRKIDDLALPNIELREGDACTADLPPGGFDHILCSAALVFMTDIPAVLRGWHRFLKPGGYVGFDAPAGNSTAAGATLAPLAFSHGISLGYARLRTREACREALADAGFEVAHIHTEIITQRIMPLSEIDAAWAGIINHPLSRPLLDLPPDTLARLRDDFRAKIASLATPEGIVDRNIMHIAFGRKPRPCALGEAGTGRAPIASLASFRGRAQDEAVQHEEPPR